MARKAKKNSTARVPRAEPKADEAPRHVWTFLTNHAHVLAVLHSRPVLPLREVANLVGITERAVQRIVHDLEADGFIQRKRVGRGNHYQIRLDRSLRHPVEAHCTIGGLLQLIGHGPGTGIR